MRWREGGLTPLALDGANAPDFQHEFLADVLDGDVEALGSFLWAIGLAVLAVILFRVVKLVMAKKQKEGYLIIDDWEILYGFCYFLSGVAGIGAFGFLISAIKWIANPEYYAIRLILQGLK